MKRITALTLGIILLGTGLSFAQAAPQVAQSVTQPVEVGNKQCPVSGEAVGKMGAPITIEYKGKLYNLCCPGCKNTFKNNPDKFSKIAVDDVKAANQ